MDRTLELDRHRQTFPFAKDLKVEPASLAFGIWPGTTSVRIDGSMLRVAFGPWRVETPLENIHHATLTGPYHWHRVAGPARYSMHDKGLTFATTTRRGVELHFVEPVRGLDLFGIVRHPNLTVTVNDPEALLNAIEEAQADLDTVEQDEHDELESMTATELRTIARQHKIPGVSRLKKDELVEALDGTGAIGADDETGTD